MTNEELKQILEVGNNRIKFWQNIISLATEKLGETQTEQNLFDYEEEIKKTVVADENAGKDEVFLTRRQAAKFLGVREWLIDNLKTNGYLHACYVGDSKIQKYSLKELQTFKTNFVIPENLINTVQAANLCNLSTTAIRYYVDKGLLKPARIFSTKGSFYFRKSDVERLVQKLKVGEKNGND